MLAMFKIYLDPINFKPKIYSGKTKSFNNISGHFSDEQFQTLSGSTKKSLPSLHKSLHRLKNNKNPDFRFSFITTLVLVITRKNLERGSFSRFRVLSSSISSILEQLSSVDSYLEWEKSPF
ncbi:hypothetical protein ACTFIR_012849 [Dictyostelium discoideum]